MKCSPIVSQISFSALLVAGIQAIGLGGCGTGSSIPNQLSGNSSVVAAPAAAIVSSDPSSWPERSIYDKSGKVSATIHELPAAKVEEMRKTYRQTALIPVPVDPKYNVQLFKIKGVDDYKDVVFIAPRLIAYGSAQHAHVAPKDNRDGTVSLSLPLALIDGTQDKILSADEKSSTPVPNELLVKEISELTASLATRFGSPQTLSILPGCPTRITLMVNDKEFDTTPTRISESDYCQINKPIQAPLRVSIEDAKFIFQKALYAGVVQASAVYETQVTFTTSAGTIKFSKQKVFEDLSAELGISGNPYADVDLKAKLTKSLKSQALSMNIQGDVTPAIDSIVTQAIHLFFEPFKADPNTETKACGPAIVCLRLSLTHSEEKGDFQAEWHQSTTGLTGQLYTTWAKMLPVQDRTVLVGGSAGNAELRNNGTSRELGLTVVAGAQIEVLPTSLTSDTRLTDRPMTVRNDNTVCVATAPTYEEVCRHRPGPDSGSYCYDKQIGTHCSRTENQWTEITTHSMDSAKMQRIDSPVGTLQVLFEGLALKFTWDSISTGEHKSATCALSAFQREGDGQSLIVTLENRKGCEIFTADSKGGVMLHLINNIHFQAKYKKGRDVKLWNGKVTEVAQDSTFDPEVDFAGQISVRGFDMMSIFSNIQKN